jgi:hypothetical protein
MILFPTRSRAWALQRFIDNYKVTGATLPVMVIIDTDNTDHYKGVIGNLPEGFTIFYNSVIRNLRDAVNLAFQFYPNEDYYGIVADDIVPHTDEWDVKLAEACKPHYIAWPNDGIWGKQNHNPELPTHPFIGGDLVRALGWIISPYTQRHCADFVWRDLADELGIGKPMSDIFLQHVHWQTSQAPFDSTYALQPSAQKDHDSYWHEYHKSEKFQEDVKRVRKALGL